MLPLDAQCNLDTESIEFTHKKSMCFTFILGLVGSDLSLGYDV
jgi:hypothetical protein